jgi:hypothetical protein
VGELTTGHLEQSVIRKPLRKRSTVTVGEKIKLKLGKRQALAGRRVRHRELYDLLANQVVSTLSSLADEELATAIARAGKLCGGEHPVERLRLYQSTDGLDRALLFVYDVHRGSAYERDALRRNPDLCKAFGTWRDKANHILLKPKITSMKKVAEERAVKRKLAAQRAVITERG